MFSLWVTLTESGHFFYSCQAELWLALGECHKSWVVLCETIKVGRIPLTFLHEKQGNKQFLHLFLLWKSADLEGDKMGTICLLTDYECMCDIAWKDGKCLYKLSEIAKLICSVCHACFWTKKFVIHLLFGCRMYEKTDLVDTSQLHFNSLWNALISTKFTQCAKEEEKGFSQFPSLF